MPDVSERDTSLTRILEEFQRTKNLSPLLRAIRAAARNRRVRIMNVCGTHEHTIARWGIRSLMPDQVELIAGPGCPVCVCPPHEVREAIALARKGVIVATFGDMMRVRTSEGSLAQAKAEGADVRVVYSCLDSLELARNCPSKEVVFFSVGFETTSAPTAAMVAQQEIPPNYTILTSQRLTPPAVSFLCEMTDNPIDGFIAPGHVSCIIGARGWDELPKRFSKPTVVTGFEPLDVVLAVYIIVKQLERGEAQLVNEYSRVVKPEGNQAAQRLMGEVFEVQASQWRGVGWIPQSGLVLSPVYRHLDARERYGMAFSPEDSDLPPGCACGDILTGRKYPPDCPLFGTRCTPSSPYGPCMVSGEGTCLIWYRYGGPKPQSGSGTQQRSQEKGG